MLFRTFGDIGHGGDRGRRRRIGRALENRIGLLHFRYAPRHHGAAGLLVHLQTRLRESIVDRQSALAHRAGEGFAIDAIRTRLVGRDGSRGGVERHQRAVVGIDQTEAAGEGRGIRGEGIGARGVHHDDARPSGRRRQSVGEIGNLDRLDGNIGVARDLRVDRHEVIVAVILHAASGQINESLHVRPDRRRLGEKIAQRAAQAVLVEVARADDFEARRLQRLRNETGVIGRRRQRMIGIGRIADDQGDAGVLRGRGILRLRPGRERQK